MPWRSCRILERRGGCATSRAPASGSTPMIAADVHATVRPRILLVDDDELLARTYARTLSADGYDVEVRYDGESAVDAVERDPFDAVLSDIDLPRLGGLALLERIHAHDPDTPVVLI